MKKIKILLLCPLLMLSSLSIVSPVFSQWSCPAAAGFSYNGCCREYNSGASVCDPNNYFSVTAGSCISETAINTEENNCSDDFSGRGADGQSPKLDRSWTCGSGCTTSQQCDVGLQNCGGTCKSAAPENNTCASGKLPSGYNHCTGLPTSCVDIALPTCSVNQIMQHDGSFWACAALPTGGSGGGKFVEGTDPDDAVYNGRFVGIGTLADPLMTPEAELHVAGSVKFNASGGEPFFDYDDDQSMGVFTSSGIFFDGSYLGINPSAAMSTMSPGLALDVEGKVGATEYCDEKGIECFTVLSVLTNMLPSCNSEQFMKYNGSNWDCEDVATITAAAGGGKFVDNPNNTSEAIYLSGSVGIGVADPANVGAGADAGTANLEVNGDVIISGDGDEDSEESTASLRVAGAVSGAEFFGLEFLYKSDARLKENITALNSSEVLDKVNKLNPVSYDWISTGQNDTGFIAQEVETIFPTFVSGSQETQYSISYGKIVSVLTAAIQEQQKQIEALTTRVNQLENK
jgi:hypothetical protein